MPLKTYLAFDDPRELARNKFILLRLVTGAGESDATLTYAEQHVADFEH